MGQFKAAQISVANALFALPLNSLSRSYLIFSSAGFEAAMSVAISNTFPTDAAKCSDTGGEIPKRSE
jgi:hypothetical protein